MKNALIITLILSLQFSYSQEIIDDSNIEDKLIRYNDRLIVLDFFATWCGPCKAMEPIFKDLETEYNQVDFYKLDVDKNKADDTFGIEAIPTIYFIYNGETLHSFEGAKDKETMKNLLDITLEAIDKVEKEQSQTSNTTNKIERKQEFTEEYINSIENNSVALNELAWFAYLEHNEIDILLKAIELVKKSIEIDRNYHNLDTHAALLYKTGNYIEALKKAKEAINVAKEKNEEYDATLDLINKIIEKM